jgi:hypothetical protein
LDAALPTSKIIGSFNAVSATKDPMKILTLATTLDNYNNLGCPLN